MTGAGKYTRYEKPEVVYLDVDKERKVVTVVLKTQIDWCAVKGKQYKWTVYRIIGGRTCEEIEEQHAYELELKEKGLKRPLLRSLGEHE